MSRHTARDMTWHKNKNVNDESVMRHPADGLAWKEFDKMYPNFAMEPRNIRLGLAIDGFNPFGNMSQSYNMWPMVVVSYNLPPWKCMKKKYTIMPLLIPARLAPGREIDVYLRSLMMSLNCYGRKVWQLRTKQQILHLISA